MEAILQSQIFFFITSVAVIIVTGILVVIGFYVIKIVKNVSEVSEIAKNTVSNTSDHLAGLKQKLKRSSLYYLIFRKVKKNKSESSKN